MFSIEDYDYPLPEELIAQRPASRRDHSRLLVLDRLRASISDALFHDLPQLLRAGDLLIVNNTRVVPARLFGRKETGGRVEILVLEHGSGNEPQSQARWCLLKASKRPRKGGRLLFEGGFAGIVEETEGEGLTRIAFEGPEPIDVLLENTGAMPLPPYIRRARGDSMDGLDRERYQTIFSKDRGAVAAPTAGLHFTWELIERLAQAGVSIAEITLHVGHGTFQPVRTRDIRDHRLGEEQYVIGSGAASAVNAAKRGGRRVIAVGTTVVRTLESAAGPGGKVIPGQGKTDLLITPGFSFRVIDGMITNFHLPRSSLLFLVSAFAGRALVRKAYEWAVGEKYRFYSYGDAMLIL